MVFPKDYKIPDEVSLKYKIKMNAAENFIKEIKESKNVDIFTNKTKSSFYFMYNNISFRVSLHKLPNLGFKFGNSPDPFRVWNSKHEKQEEIILENRIEIYKKIIEILK